MSVTDDLLVNARRYAETFDKGDLPLPPALGVAVVACMDARLNVYGLLGLEEGQAHVIRNAGGVVTPDEISRCAAKSADDLAADVRQSIARIQISLHPPHRLRDSSHLPGATRFPPEAAGRIPASSRNGPAESFDDLDADGPPVHRPGRSRARSSRARTEVRRLRLRRVHRAAAAQPVPLKFVEERDALEAGRPRAPGRNSTFGTVSMVFEVPRQRIRFVASSSVIVSSVWSSSTRH